MYPEGWAKLSALIIFLGFNLTFFPQFILGYLGMPRRYHVYPDEFQVLHVLSTAGASVLAVGYVMPMIYFIWSLRYGKVAGANPWGATGLEWRTVVAAARAQLRGDAGRHARSLRLQHGHGGGNRSWLITLHVETLALREQFDTAAQQKDASTLGMWIFLVTEIMFFGGMFLAYTIYRSAYPNVFAVASSSLNVYIGAANTIVLLCSSLTMVLAVRAAQLGQRKAIVLFLILTLVARVRLPGREGLRVEREVRRASRSRADASTWRESRRSCRGRRSCSSRCTSR